MYILFYIYIIIYVYIIYIHIIIYIYLYYIYVVKCDNAVKVFFGLVVGVYV